MPQFRFKAVAPDGSVSQGRMEASDQAAAAARLQSQGQLPLTLEVSTSVTGWRAVLSQEIGGSGRRGPRVVADLMGRLALLLDAGIALEIALTLLSSVEGTRGVKEIATNLLRKLRSGSSLSDAMAIEGGVFSPVVVAMVRAGEASGMLASVLGRLADHLARAEAVRRSIQSALVYPAVLIATAAGSVLLVLLVVLPQLEPVFLEAGDRLPFLTRAAFATSAFIREKWWVVITLLGAATLLIRRLLRDPSVVARRDSLVLRFPILGLTVRRAEAGRFARVLGTLIGGGVTLPVALTLARPVLSNRVIVEGVERAIVAVREGGGLAGPLSQSSVFPEIAIQMIRIGEATGRLDAMLLRLADLLEAEVQHTLSRSLALLVPALTICLGGVVASVVASVMLAILGISDLLH